MMILTSFTAYTLEAVGANTVEVCLGIVNVKASCSIETRRKSNRAKVVSYYNRKINN